MHAPNAWATHASRDCVVAIDVSRPSVSPRRARQHRRALVRSPAASTSADDHLADLARPVLRSHGRSNSAFQIGAKTVSVDTAPPMAKHALFTGSMAAWTAAGLGLAFAAHRLKRDLDTPGRPWMDGTTVGREYDAWTEEQILEYYWGEHIHLGYYSDDDLAKGAGTLLGCKVKDFIEAKLDFCDEMLAWSECPDKPAKVLDVGCGIGGTSRHLAKTFGSGTQVTGITLSPKQVKRATELAKEQNLPNASFRVMNALEMEFPADTFDMVWACESGEHMPDKKKYVEEMVRVLKPGGRLVIATWCQRSTPPAFTEEDLVNLDYLYKEWAHPYFISIEEYASLVEGTTTMRDVDTDDWTRQTIASWRHSIWAGVWDPIPVFSRPNIWYKTLRDIVCLERMRRAFGRGLMQYGMIKGVKVKASR